MSSKMLIDASHAEETRVVISKGSKIVDFDFESEHKKQIRGNIYLAKVTRVEPSLQAAFVEYGGNRHGFLAFSEIHPDYYQIPVADREALLREYQRELEADEADETAGFEAFDGDASDDDDDERPAKSKRRSRRGGRSRRSRSAKGDENGAEDDDDGSSSDQPESDDADDGDDVSLAEMAVEEDSVSEEPAGEGDADKPKRRSTRRRKAPLAASEDADATVEAASAGDADAQADGGTAEEPPAKPKRPSRRKKADDAAPAEAAAEGAVESTTAGEASDEAPKPKRRSTRRKKADTSEEVTADAGAETSETGDEEVAPAEVAELALNEAEGGAEEKPKRKRTSRRRKKADDATAQDDETEAREAAPSEDEDVGTATEVASDDEENVEETGAEDALEEAAPRRQRAPRKNYKIQEVIKRRQILLVQVTKEERGNKGAALTTYLSLAGRYSVLMPNTARGGGISRKIAQASDRKRLKEIAKSLDVPEGMGVILRTAAAARTEQEVNRDFDYLMRLWDSVRELTLKSAAPALVYEEGNLIKRSIRDLYNKEIDDIVVAGERGYREAKDFMKMLMPSQARVVKRWDKRTPLLAAHGVEAELDRMLQPSVTLRSGGYIIINQTEALVAIDVNSGRATREHSIEATALQTNLEAAEEVARQLRLRDLAGLIVIDFIDMDEKRNNRSVEKRLKDCLKDDRARIQLGRISSFGLLEMSRQRMRSSVLESTMQVCDRCNGTGHVRSASSISLQVTRAIEEQLRKSPNHDVIAKTDTATALYLLNSMRGYLAELEAEHGVDVKVEIDGNLPHQSFSVERGAFVERAEERRQGIRQDASLMVEEDEGDDTDPTEDAPSDMAEPTQARDNDDEGDRGKGRRRRGRRGGRGKGSDDKNAAASENTDDGEQSETGAGNTQGSDDTGLTQRPRRSSRGRSAASQDEGEATESSDQIAATREADTENESPNARPSRSTRRRRAPIASPQDEAAADSEASNAPAEVSGSEGGNGSADRDASEDRPSRRSTRRRKAPMSSVAASSEAPATQASIEPQTEASDAQIEPAPARRRSTRRKAPVAEPVADVGEADNVIETIAAANGTDAVGTASVDDDATSARGKTVEPDDDAEGEDKPKKGWWQRGFF